MNDKVAITAVDVVKIVKEKFGIKADLPLFESSLNKVVDASKKHLDFAKLVEIGKSSSPDDNIEFAKTISNAVNRVNEDNTFKDGFVPKCGFAV